MTTSAGSRTGSGTRPRRRLPLPACRAGERGSSAVELVLVTPALMLLIFAVVQAALYFYARQVVIAAAAQADRTARAAAEPDAATVQAAAVGYIRQLGPQLLAAPTVTLTRTPSTATVTVVGQAVSILPGLHLSVRASQTGPVERFTPDLGGSS